MPVKPVADAIRLDEFLPYMICLVADQVSRETGAIAKRHDLNQSHWRVLAAIADEPGRTANEVVAVTPMDKGIVSRAVKGLIEMGMVTREASNEDGRIGHLFLTSAGAKRYKKIAMDIQHVDNMMTKDLSPRDVQSLVLAMGRLSEALNREASRP